MQSIESSEGDEPWIRCDSVSRVYKRDGQQRKWIGSRSKNRASRVVALDTISLDFTPGELTVVAGPSGSGKSTLLHLLAALDLPTKGQVFIEGTDTTALSERDRTALRRRSIGIIFQRFHLLPALDARSNVALPLIEAGRSKSERHERAEEVLTSVGLDHRLDHRPYELSGGEQQRVAIARALVNEPAILIADEPTGELDSETGGQIITLLEDIATERVVVVASHDPAIIDRGDRVVRLADGRVVDGG